MAQQQKVTVEDMSAVLDSVFVPLPERPHFSWPGEKQVALILQLSIEYFRPAQPELYSGGPGLVSAPIPAGSLDFLNWAWRNYGVRVGVWRLLEVFAEHGVPVSASTNAIIHERFPQITEALRAGNCDLQCAHGYIQDRSLLEFFDDPQGHDEYVLKCLAAHEELTGVKPRGWVSPAVGLLPETLPLLAANGIEWVAFPCDDQPFIFEVGGYELVGMPHGVNLTDYNTLIRGYQSMDQWIAAVLEGVDVLADEAARTGSGRVMQIGIHPQVMGQPFRSRRFGELLGRLKARDDLWWATPTEAAAFYRDRVGNVD